MQPIEQKPTHELESQIQANFIDFRKTEQVYGANFLALG